MIKSSKEYKQAKNYVDNKYKKHSAYKSQQLVKKYKELGGKFTKKKEKNLSRWINEKWKNLTPYALGLIDKIKDSPKCGVKHPKQGNNKSICRPTKKINKNTPDLAQSYTKQQIKKALNMKNKNKTITWDSL